MNKKELDIVENYVILGHNDKTITTYNKKNIHNIFA
jgi:hypothetical protein